MIKSAHLSQQPYTDLAILIVSCDRYSDIWAPFFSLFWKYWPDCSYPVYLGANREKLCDSKVAMALSQDDFSWASSVRAMLEQINSGYVLILLEDFFLRKEVDNNRVQHCLNILREVDGGYLRLKPFPKPDLSVPGYPEVGEIRRGAPYRSALQAAIWRKDILYSMLRDGETAWDMELIGSRRSDNLPSNFYSTWKPVLIYEAGVTKGKWIPSAVRRCHLDGISPELDKRAVLTNREYGLWFYRRWINNIINTVSWQRRRPIGDLLRKVHFLPSRVDTSS